jgi:hypothetical protein
MAGSKLTGKSRIRASSLLEVIISMVIILLVFTMAMMISANVMRSSLSVKKINAQAVLHELLGKAEQDKEASTNSFMIDSLRIDQVVKPYNETPALLEIHLIAFDTNQEKVAELQKVVINKNE